MTHWSVIHTRFPEICEGEKRKGGHRGCCAWNDGQGFCNRIITGGGECSLSVDEAAERQKQILKGEI